MNTGTRVLATEGLRTVSFFGELLVNYGKINLAKYTVVQSIKDHLCSCIQITNFGVGMIRAEIGLKIDKL
jgi:hypothetical protein